MIKIYSTKCEVMDIYSCDGYEATEYAAGMYLAGWKVVIEKDNSHQYFQVIDYNYDSEYKIHLQLINVNNQTGIIDNRYEQLYKATLDNLVKKKYKHKKGYIYILSNPYMPQIFKIGKTTQTPQTRANKLSQALGVIGKFNVEFQILVDDCDLVEVLVHQKLKDKRINIEREFFKVNLDEAKKTILEYKDEVIENFRKTS